MPTQIVTAYAGNSLAAHKNLSVILRAPPGQGPTPSVVPVLAAETRVWFNPDLRSRVYFVPGVIVNIIALVTIMLTAMSIVREKELGTMEQLMVTPMRPFELIMGKLLPFAMVGVLEVAFVVLAALAGIPDTDPGKHSPGVWVFPAVSAFNPWSRSFHIDHFSNPTAGDDVFLLFLYAGDASERFCLPDPQYASSGAVFDLSESPALLHADCAGSFSEGSGYRSHSGRKYWRFFCSASRFLVSAPSDSTKNSIKFQRNHCILHLFHDDYLRMSTL